MTPPDALVSRGFRMLPCMGDGRQSGTSDSPSILNASPESAAGGNLAILQTGDQVKVDLKSAAWMCCSATKRSAQRRRRSAAGRAEARFPLAGAVSRHVGQLQTGACLDFAVGYRDLRKTVPRHSH